MSAKSKEELNSRRRQLRDLIVPLCQQSRKNLAISNSLGLATICNSSGLKRFGDDCEISVPWSRMSRTQVLYFLQSEWRPMDPKSPLDWLAECAPESDND